MPFERMRLAAAAALVLFSASTQAVVRGGVQVIPLPDGATSARYQDRPVLVVEQPQPTAIIGIALDALVGPHVLVVVDGETHAKRQLGDAERAALLQHVVTA